MGAVIALMDEEARAFSSRATTTPDWLRSIWFAPGIDRENDTAVVVDRTGAVVGSLSVESDPPFTAVEGIGAVALAHHGRGVGAGIVAEIERRSQRFVALAPEATTVTLTMVTMAREPLVARLLACHGYAQGTHTSIAELEFADSPPSPPPDPQVSVATVAPGQERAVYECMTAAFADEEWERGWASWELWRHRYMENRPLDLGLWFAVYDGDHVAGALVGRELAETNPCHGWVSLLGVRPSSRGRGVASALLQRAFAEFRARGRTGAGLMVTFDDPTAASRLYERVGMKMTPTLLTWTKVLRAGG